MGLTGDFRKLARLGVNLGRFATGEVERTLAKKLGEAALQLVKREFEGGHDPYGTPWKPLSSVTIQRSPRRMGGKVLLDTGRLRRSFHRLPVPNGFVITSGVKYAAIHNFGGMAGRGRKVRIPRRQILPDRITGLPASWRRVFVAEAGDIVRRTLRRRTLRRR